MNLLSNSTAFVIMLITGMVVVGINAATQFRTPVPDTGIGSFDSLLNGLPIHLLTLRRKYSAGFLIYLSIIESIFLILSSSTVLLQAFMQFTGNTGSIGALAANNSDINPYIPILASSVVVTASQLKPFNVVEHFLRKTTHRIVSSAIQIETMASDIENTIYPSLPLNDVDEKQIKLIEQKISASCQKAGWSKAQVKRFNELRNDIRFLDSWTNGDDSKIFKSLEGITEISRLKARLDSEVDVFQDALRRAVEWDSSDTHWPPALNRSQKPVSSSADFWAYALMEAEKTKRDLSVLLALYLSNLPDAVHGIEDVNIRTMFLSLQHPTSAAGKYSTIATGATVGSIVCFITFFTYHLTISASIDVASSYSTLVSPSKVYEQSFTALPKEVLSEDDESQLRNNQDDEHDAIVKGGLPSSESNDISTKFRLDVGQYFTRISRKSISQAFWDACIYGTMFFVAAAVAVTASTSRSPSSMWRPWSRRNFPFWQYMKVGAIASLLTFSMYSLLLFIRLVLLPSLTMENTVLSVTLLADFKNHFAVGSGVPLMAFSVACSVCYLYDKLRIDKSMDNESLDSGTHIEADISETRLTDNRTLKDVFSSGFYRCRVFSGFVEKRDYSGINIGIDIILFSLIAAGINTLVMLNAGIISSPKQLLSAILLPALAFFIIVATYFELMTLDSKARHEDTAGSDPHTDFENSDRQSRLNELPAENQTERTNENTENN